MKDESGNIFQPQEGYRKFSVTNQAFTSQFAINCSADRLPELLLTLTRVCFSDTAYGIIEYYSLGENNENVLETYLSPFLDLSIIVSVFKNYMFQLVNDGQVAFGFAWYDTKRHEEIFVDDHKIITVMTSQFHTVTGVLQDADIPEIDNLEFISQHAHGHLNLTAIAKLSENPELLTALTEKQINYTGEIIKTLNMKKQ
ncbi:MAG: hypothetical protein ABIL05_03130 [candidate division WOR-3 bacterium]